MHLVNRLTAAPQYFKGRFILTLLVIFILVNCITCYRSRYRSRDLTFFDYYFDNSFSLDQLSDFYSLTNDYYNFEEVVNQTSYSTLDLSSILNADDGYEEWLQNITDWAVERNITVNVAHYTVDLSTDQFNCSQEWQNFCQFAENGHHIDPCDQHQTSFFLCEYEGVTVEFQCPQNTYYSGQTHFCQDNQTETVQMDDSNPLDTNSKIEEPVTTPTSTQISFGSTLTPTLTKMYSGPELTITALQTPLTEVSNWTPSLTQSSSTLTYYTSTPSNTFPQQQPIASTTPPQVYLEVSDLTPLPTEIGLTTSMPTSSTSPDLTSAPSQTPLSEYPVLMPPPSNTQAVFESPFFTPTPQQNLSEGEFGSTMTPSSVTQSVEHVSTPTLSQTLSEGQLGSTMTPSSSTPSITPLQGEHVSTPTLSQTLAEGEFGTTMTPSSLAPPMTPLQGEPVLTPMQSQTLSEGELGTTMTPPSSQNLSEGESGSTMTPSITLRQGESMQTPTLSQTFTQESLATTLPSQTPLYRESTSTLSPLQTLFHEVSTSTSAPSQKLLEGESISTLAPLQTPLQEVSTSTPSPSQKLLEGESTSTPSPSQTLHQGESASTLAPLQAPLQGESTSTPTLSQMPLLGESASTLAPLQTPLYVESTSAPAPSQTPLQAESTSAPASSQTLLQAESSSIPTPSQTPVQGESTSTQASSQTPLYVEFASTLAPSQTPLYVQSTSIPARSQAPLQGESMSTPTLSQMPLQGQSISTPTISQMPPQGQSTSTLTLSQTQSASTLAPSQTPLQGEAASTLAPLQTMLQEEFASTPALSQTPLYGESTFTSTPSQAPLQGESMSTLAPSQTPLYGESTSTSTPSQAPLWGEYVSTTAPSQTPLQEESTSTLAPSQTPLQRDFASIPVSSQAPSYGEFEPTSTPSHTLLQEVSASTLTSLQTPFYGEPMSTPMPSPTPLYEEPMSTPTPSPTPLYGEVMSTPAPLQKPFYGESTYSNQDNFTESLQYGVLQFQAYELCGTSEALLSTTEIQNVTYQHITCIDKQGHQLSSYSFYKEELNSSPEQPEGTLLTLESMATTVMPPTYSGELVLTPVQTKTNLQDQFTTIPTYTLTSLGSPLTLSAFTPALSSSLPLGQPTGSKTTPLQASSANTSMLQTEYSMQMPTSFSPVPTLVPVQSQKQVPSPTFTPTPSITSENQRFPFLVIPYIPSSFGLGSYLENAVEVGLSEELPRDILQGCYKIQADEYKLCVGEWSECDNPCGVGLQYRSVVCYSIIFGFQIPSDLENCGSQNIPKVQRCQNLDNNCPESNESVFIFNKMSQWSKCSGTCPEGQQNREYECHEYNTTTKFSQLIENSEQCASEGLVQESRPCTLPFCDLFYWSVGEWSGCNEPCGGISTRVIKCVDFELESVEDDKCGNLKPSSEVQCQECAQCSNEDIVVCNNQGECVDGQCSCFPGFSGMLCEVQEKECSSGVLSSEGECCESGVLEWLSGGTCCPFNASYLTLQGECCEGSQKECSCKGRDASETGELWSECCIEGILDVGGRCCEVQELDDCGVCQGDGSSCIYQAVLAIVPTNQNINITDISGRSSKAFQSLQQQLSIKIKYFLEENETRINIVSATSNVPFQIYGRTLRKLLQSDQILSAKGIIATVNFEQSQSFVRPLSSQRIQGALIQINNQGGINIEEEEGDLLLMIDESGSEVYGLAQCGDRSCRVGEKFSWHVQPTQCPFGSQASLQCSGHGFCLYLSGQCECQQGYMGSACEQCEGGFKQKEIIKDNQIIDIQCIFDTSKIVTQNRFVQQYGISNDSMLPQVGLPQVGGFGVIPEQSLGLNSQNGTNNQVSSANIFSEWIWLVVFIVIAIVLLVVVCCIVIICCRRTKKKKQEEATNENVQQRRRSLETQMSAGSKLKIKPPSRQSSTVSSPSTLTKTNSKFGSFTGIISPPTPASPAGSPHAKRKANSRFGLFTMRGDESSPRARVGPLRRKYKWEMSEKEDESSRSKNSEQNVNTESRVESRFNPEHQYSPQLDAPFQVDENGQQRSTQNSTSELKQTHPRHLDAPYRV